MRLVALGILCVGLVACVESSSLVCGDTTCPSDYICTEQEFCVAADAIAECTNKLDGDDCTTRTLPGQCVGGYCVAIVCGNGVMEPGEVCDDGNRTSGDDCDSTCRSLEVCGNGIVDVGELCDCGDGMAGHDNTTCAMANSGDDAATCRPDCTPHGCGDGEIENSEQCEPGVALPLTATCRDLFDRYQGTVTCNNVCRYDASGCTEFCGDGVVNDASEACDTAAPTDFCIDYGYDAGDLTCSGLCRPAFAACRRIGWTPYTLDNRQFHSVFALSPTDAWGGGGADRLLHWDGLSWQASTIPGAVGGIVGIWGSSATDLFAATSTVIYRYNGTNWSTSFTLPGGSTLNAISGSGSRVIAVGEAGAIYTYDGANWSTMTSNTGLSLGAVHVVSATLAYAGGTNEDYSILLEWTGGASWSPKATPPTHRIDAVYATSSTNLYIGTRSLMHWDGSRWTSVPLGIDGDVYGLSGSSANDVYAVFVGNDNAIAHYDGESWSIHDTGQLDVADVAAAGGGYAFSCGITMARYEGSTWAHVRPEAPSAITAISAPASSSNVFAVGERGVAMKWDGVFWRTVPSEVTEPLYAVSRTIAAGEFGTFAVFDGTRFVDHSITATNENTLHAAWAAADNDAWAAGSGGTFVHWDGAATTVTTVAGSPQLRAMWGTATNNIYAVGEGGAMLRYDGGSWTPFASGTTTHMFAMSGTSASNFYIAGDNGEVRQWTGAAWTPLPKPTTRRILGLFAQSTIEVFAVTGDNTLYAWNGSTWQTYTMATPATAITGRPSTVEIYAAGPQLSLMRRIADNSTFRAEIPTFGPNEIAQDIYAATANDIWAARIDGLYHFDGYHWTRVNYATLGPTAVHGSGPNNVFVISSSSLTVYHWNGTTFLQEASGATGSLLDVFAIGASDGWLTSTGGSGVSNSIRRYNGSSWGAATNPTTTVSPVSLFAFNSTEAYAVGTNGGVLHFENGAWGVETTPATATLFEVWASSPTDVYAVGLNNTVVHWNGQTWEQPAAGLTPTWNGVVGSSSDDVFLLGTGSSLWYRGAAFTPVMSPITQDFTAGTIIGKSTYFSTRAPLRMIRLQRDAAW